VYAELYPQEVAGMVLVDPTHEDTTLINQGKFIRIGGCSRCGSLSRMFEALWNQQHWALVCAKTSGSAAQKPNAP
jgi:hypothetical protein